MTWLAILMALTMQGAAPSVPSKSPPVPVRACVDAKGAQAECGRDPEGFHECRAADGYGRCPDDPKCFDSRGAQVRCVRPVLPVDLRQVEIRRITPMPSPSAASPIGAPAWVRACIDRNGRDADCGPDPDAWHECYAADAFGACPDDPKCYDGAGRRARCVLPVVHKVARCPDGTPAAIVGEEKSCVGHRGVSAGRP